MESFIEGQAEKYLMNKFGGGGGGSGQGGGGGGGMDWSNLSNLAGHFTQAQNQYGGDVSPQTFQQHLASQAGGQGGYGGPQQGMHGGYDQGGYGQQSQYGGGGEYGGQSQMQGGYGGQAPPGYPTQSSSGNTVPANANPDVIHQLLGEFSNRNNGQQFTGGAGQYQQLAGIASSLTGSSMSSSMLEKLVKWKLEGMM